ncbi:hypothetical protein [Mycobacteroides immunogenum]|nr:hypothetical protein [Mycobacteroides immunogenum]
MDSPNLRTPDCSGLDPRLAPAMARHHAATVTAVEAARNLTHSENDGGDQ